MVQYGHCIYYPSLCEEPVFVELKYPIPLKTPACITKLQNLIKESFMSFKADNGRYLFSLLVIPNVREILLAIVAECEIQFMNSFMVKPRKLKHDARSIFLLLIIKSGMSSFAITLWWLRKTMNLVFSTIRDNLLTVNQSEIFSNSELICDHYGLHEWTNITNWLGSYHQHTKWNSIYH